MTSAQPIEEWLYCIECQEPHSHSDGTLDFSWEDMESLSCHHPERVERLPKDWERHYEAHLIWGGDKTEYDLYLRHPPADPSIHRPMYYLEDG